jgi:hypothetical protein
VVVFVLVCRKLLCECRVVLLDIVGAVVVTIMGKIADRPRFRRGRIPFLAIKNLLLKKYKVNIKYVTFVNSTLEFHVMQASILISILTVSLIWVCETYH